MKGVFNVITMQNENKISPMFLINMITEEKNKNQVFVLIYSLQPFFAVLSSLQGPSVYSMLHADTSHHYSPNIDPTSGRNAGVQLVSVDCAFSYSS